MSPTSTAPINDKNLIAAAKKARKYKGMLLPTWEGRSEFLLPELKSDEEILLPDYYPLEVKKNVCYTRLVRNKDTHELLYEILLPPRPLSYDLLERVLFSNYDQLDWDESTLHQIILENKIEDKDGSLAYQFLRDYLGYGIIDPLFSDRYLEDISYGGGGPEGGLMSNVVWIYHNKFGYIPTNLKFGGDLAATEFLRRLARRRGIELSLAKPISGFQLENGSRIESRITREISPLGPSFAIRVFRRRPLTYLDFIKSKSADESIYAFLWYAVENKSNIAVIGGTASGKTTLLNSILLFIPDKWKVVTIEDTRELNFERGNWGSMLPRDTDIKSGKATINEVNMNHLLATSLRQRPDYLIVGEVRGVETRAMIQAMATGQTTLTTFHANDISSFKSRLTSPPISVTSRNLANIHLVVIVKKISNEERKVANIYESSVTPSGDTTFLPVMTYENGEFNFNWKTSLSTVKRISGDSGKTPNQILNEIDKRARVLRDLNRENWREVVWKYA